MNILHISDPHFTASGHTLDWSMSPFLHDNQDSRRKSSDLASWIINNYKNLATNTVLLTGDLTDSGDEEDYAIAMNFLNTLKNAGLSVLVVPGNHDCCKEGNVVFAKLCQALRAPLDQVYVPTPWPTRILDCPAWIRDPLLKTLVAPVVRTTAATLLPPVFPGSAQLINYITSDIVGFMKNSDSNNQRRTRFVAKVTHYSDYPHAVLLPDAALVLLDSMQGQFEEPNPLYCLAQGNLGRRQRLALSAVLAGLQAERKRRPIVVALHHSPFSDDELVKLTDSREFLGIVKGKIDCLLFGHTGNPHVRMTQQEAQYGIPVINSENLEKMSASYPVSLVRLDSRDVQAHETNPPPPQPSRPPGENRRPPTPVDDRPLPRKPGMPAPQRP